MLHQNNPHSDLLLERRKRKNDIEILVQVFSLREFFRKVIYELKAHFIKDF